jgi:CHAT domain-containing protein
VEGKQRKKTQIARRERCKTLTGAEVADGEPLPFNIAKANELYHMLFGQVEDLLRNPDGTFRHLLVVPSGPLTQLPFQVLVAGKSEAAVSAGYAKAEWLIRRHAITVLPSAASLRALRQNAKTSRATKPLIGFGNPLLDGNPEKPWQAEAARKARERERCPETMQQVASLVGPGGDVAWLPQQKGVSDVAQIRFQAPLPETADELCAVASDLGVPGEEIRLGSRATEREVKALSSSGALATYRILQFSTHGALAGHMSGNAEPGLILTPPETATPEDDGYLSASEITALKLDADWVILSACDTAAGGAEGAEALSGLARSFFYAGARALLVSHWSVYSDATVKLITKAVSAMATDTSVGRSEALRRSMVALIEQGEPQEAQPAFWAPFVVVGEGSAPLELAAANALQPAPADTSGAVSMVPLSAPSVHAPAKKKMKRKPTAGDDWITGLFGQ